MKDIFIFGTCRVCYPIHNNIIFCGELRKYHSRYYKINDAIDIFTQPVNYTTKLNDILDSLLYMKGEMYGDKNPKTDKTFQSFFFRGHLSNDDTIMPKTHPLNYPEINFHKIIIEVFSIKQNIINNNKYGNEYYLANLPWKIQTGYEHSVKFNNDDVIVKHMDKGECFEMLDKIKSIVRCCVLIIGPYVSKKVPEHVNLERIETQKILKEYCDLRKDFEYFDMSNHTSQGNIETDSTHLTTEGTVILSQVLYDFMTK